MTRSTILASLLVGLGAIATPARALASEPAALATSGERPRRNLRLAFGFGWGSIPPTLCSGCQQFEGRGVAIKLEIGWTLRPGLVLSLVERGTVIGFADDTDAGIVLLGLEALYFRTPRTHLLAGLGFGGRTMDSYPRRQNDPDNWMERGGTATGGIGYDLGRAGAFSLTVEGTATALVTRRSLSGLLMTLVGASWN